MEYSISLNAIPSFETMFIIICSHSWKMTGFDETLDPKVRFGTKYNELMYDDVSGPDRGCLSSLIYIVLERSHI